MEKINRKIILCQWTIYVRSETLELSPMKTNACIINPRPESRKILVVEGDLVDLHTQSVR